MDWRPDLRHGDANKSGICALNAFRARHCNLSGSASANPWAYADGVSLTDTIFLPATVIRSWTSRLGRHAVMEVDELRAEGAGLDQFEIHAALAPGKERDATADEHRMDHDPVLVDQTQAGRLDG